MELKICPVCVQKKSESEGKERSLKFKSSTIDDCCIWICNECASSGKVKISVCTCPMCGRRKVDFAGSVRTFKKSADSIACKEWVCNDCIANGKIQNVVEKAEVRTDPEYGTFTDPRDGNVYKTVKIGNQVWMAENLRYEGGFAADGRGSFAYDDDPDLAKIYGRLYTWSGAMNINSKYNEVSVPSVLMKKTRKGDYCQGIAPEGWHIPSKEELETLLRYVKRQTGVCDKESLSSALRASGEWEGCDGSNASGFSALPAGSCYSNGQEFADLGNHARFWSSTESNEDYAYCLHIIDYFADVGSYYKDNGYSVRCLKDSN